MFAQQSLSRTWYTCPKLLRACLNQIKLNDIVTISTVNCEYFDVKIFSDSMACAKIKRTNYMRNTNDNAVQGRLSKKYLTRKIIA